MNIERYGLHLQVISLLTIALLFQIYLLVTPGPGGIAHQVATALDMGDLVSLQEVSDEHLAINTYLLTALSEWREQRAACGRFVPADIAPPQKRGQTTVVPVLLHCAEGDTRLDVLLSRNGGVSWQVVGLMFSPEEE